MGLSLVRAFTLSTRSLNDPGTPFYQAVLQMMEGGLSKAGFTVTQERATSLTAFWCGVRIIAETVASVPLCIYERQDRGRRKAEEHPLFPLLHDEPNPDMSSYTVRELMQAQLTMHGNGYAAIVRDGGGRIRQLWPLISQKVDPRREDGELIYYVDLSNGKREPWQRGEILHIPGLSFDGIKGKSVIAAARDALGTGIAVQDYGATFFKHGARPPGVVETQMPTINADNKKNLGETWLSGRGDNWHQVAFLPKGMKYTAVGISPDDAQWLESKKFTVAEVARILNLPPHLLKDLERATFSNIEQQALEFVIYSMRPTYVRWEQELNRKLLTPEERTKYEIAFNMQALLRGDTAARGAFYSILRQWGIFSANDVRELEDLTTLGPKGDIYLSPINMTNAEELTAGGAGPAPGAQGYSRPLPAGAPARLVREMAGRTGIRGLPLRRRIRKAQQPIIEDRARQIVGREIGAVEKMLKELRSAGSRGRRDRAGFRRQLDEFYDGHAEWAGQRMRPILHSYAELVSGAMADELATDPGDQLTPKVQKFVDDYSKRFGIREASEGRLQLLAVLDDAADEDAAAEIEQRLTEWGQKRPGKIAVNESVQFMAATAKTLYIAAGVTVLRWVANATACPFCSEMDGRVAGVEKNFVNAGQGVDGGEGTDGPMKPSDNIGHPPLHNGCECDVVAD
jgi:HK97 family phage portal protein